MISLLSSAGLLLTRNVTDRDETAAAGGPASDGCVGTRGLGVRQVECLAIGLAGDFLRADPDVGGRAIAQQPVIVGRILGVDGVLRSSFSKSLYEIS